MRPTPRTRLAVAICGSVLLSGACLGQNDLGFHVAPRRICTGDTVLVRWEEAEGRAFLTASPSAPGTGPVEEDGTLRVTL